MASVDVGVALLGYGTVGASVSRMLAESGDEIERATGHRLRVVRALVRDLDKERSFAADDGVLTTDFDEIRSGAFANELFTDDEDGRPRFEQLRREGAERAKEIERVGKELRELAGIEGLLGAEAHGVS